ncbi:MAG: hypothetical protein H6Q89_2646, partial [Myxococcaceae bacterium]|nr:hypothetical protein [Myxococcaceae bacterium]
MTRAIAADATSSSFHASIDDPPAPEVAPRPEPGRPAARSQVSAFKPAEGTSAAANWVHQEVEGFEKVWKEEWGKGWVVADGNVEKILDAMKHLSAPAFGAAMNGVEGDLEKFFEEMTPAQRGAFIKLAEAKSHLTREPSQEPRSTGSCAPRAPALLRNDPHLPEPTQALVRDANLLSARAYRDAFEGYARTANAKPGEVASELREPGTHDVLRGSLTHSWAEGVGATASEYLADKREGLDLSARIQNLRPGEEAKLEIEAGASFGESIKVKGSIEVKCEQVDGRPEFAVEVDAQCLAGLKLPALELMGGIDGRASFTFQSAEEAAVAAERVKQVMEGSAVGALTALDPQVRSVFEKHLSAVELGPKGLAAAGKRFDAPFLKRSLGAEAKAELQESARIEFRQGKPELVTSLTAKLDAEVGLSDRATRLVGRIFGGSEGAKLAGQLKLPDAKAELKVKYQRRFPLEGENR